MNDKKYLSELIGEKYKKWDKKKVLITAPTGMGKTTFILNVLLPYLQDHGKKMLILCNRRLLKMQYGRDFVLQYDQYDKLKKSVDLKTYQQLQEEMGDKESLKFFFSQYDYIVLDECHFFYADCDFNGAGTFSLFQKIIYAGFAKTMIFLSATMDEVEPLITRSIRNCSTALRYRSDNFKEYERCDEIIYLDYSFYENYDRFKCLCVPDEDTLCEFIAHSDSKTLFFIDNKEKALELQKKLYELNLKSKDVFVLNANNLEDEKSNPVIRQLTINHKLLPKIFITTAVLDNGVSWSYVKI